MAIGRISGPLLSQTLFRDNVPIAFYNTSTVTESPVLYLDVSNGRIGIRTSSPSYALDVAGHVNAENLRVIYTGPGTGVSELGNLIISNGTITTSVGPVTIQPSGNDSINLTGNTLVTGDLHATGNITADGDIVLGNNTGTDTVVFDSLINSDLSPAIDSKYKLGNEQAQWVEAYAKTVISDNIKNLAGNIAINPASNLLEINGDIRVKGTNPIGTAPVVTNVLYVTMDGIDTNDGRAEDSSRACRTVGGALRSPYYRPGTLIRVRSGHYFENNPLLMLPNTAIVGDDLRTTSLEPINKTQDLFHVQSGCYIAQLQFYNGRSGLLPGPYAAGSNRGAYAVAFPPLVNGAKLDVYQSPYTQNCTNQSGPWLVDGTLFVPNQTIQLPSAVATTTFPANTSTVIVTVSTGSIVPGMSVISGPQTPGFFAARTLLLANKEFIKDQIIAFIAQEYPDFVYEQAKCARDVGIIVENIAYDATFGGNEKSVESGLAYYSGVINLIEGQQVETTAAINYINTLSQYIINNELAPIISSATTQVINIALVEGGLAAEEITAGINIITTIINSGTSVAPQIFKSCGPETPLVSAEILLQTNRIFLQEEVTAYVDAQYPNFTYNKDFCYRDVGLIVDAVSQDIVVGGNTKTLEAALSYYIGSTGDSSAAEQAILANFALIADIILNGPSVAPAPISGPNLGTSFSNAATLLQDNKNFVQSEVSAYVRSLFTTEFRLTQAQQNLCYRDIGLILAAIAADVTTGGNTNTVAAGLAYYSGNLNILPPEQISNTALVIEYMTVLSSNIVKNIKNTGLFQVLVAQVVSLPAATLVEAALIAANIDLITDIITLGPTSAPPATPISLVLTTSTAAINAFSILTANKSFLAKEVSGYIDDVFGGGFNYNPAKCSRDTGLIVDSLAFDLLYEGNTQAIFSGLQYWNQGATTVPNEVTTTTNAINYAKALAKQIAVNDIVVSLQTVSTQTVDLLNSGTIAEVDTIDQLFTTITNILVNGTVGVTSAIIPNAGISSDANVVNAYTLVQANKTFIEDEVVAYVNFNNPSFVYDRTKCARDVGLIVDSLAQDLLFDGISQSNFAGLQYWNQTTTTIPGEESTTTNAIAYVRDLAVKILTNNTTGARYQSAISQTTGTSATVVETQTIYDDFNLIIDIIVNGTAGVTDKIVPNSLIASVDTNVTNAYTLIQLNRDYLIAEAIAYIEATKTLGFTYDSAKCERDVGYMIDSVSFDLKYTGNKQAIQSGVYYFGFSNVDTAVPNEQVQVTEAYNYIKLLSSYIITGSRLPTQYQYTINQVISSSVGTNTEVTAVAANVDLIIDIITNTPSAAAPPSPIGLVASTDAQVVDAAALLADNRAFITAEVVAYIDSVFPVGFVYNQTTCRRDVGYIIDCISFDLLRSGNRQSTQAGVYYYGFNSTSSVLTYEITQAIAAYNHISRIASDIVKGNTIVPTTGNIETQVIPGVPATDNEAMLIADGISIITDIINNGPSAAYDKTPIGLVASGDANILAAHNALLDNREFIKSEILAYIDYNFTTPFVFDKIKCQRDTELIIDSVALDLIYEGSTQSAFAGLQYWAQGATAIPGEVSTTTNAILYAKTLAQAYFSTQPEIDSVGANFDTIVAIITTGTSGVSDIIIPNELPSTNHAVLDAYNLLLANKVTIQEETIIWVEANKTPGFVYDSLLCYRDIGFIIDCIAFDLLHTGNRQSIQAGVYYYGFDENTSTIINETPQTTAAYAYLKYTIRNILQNKLIDRSYQVSYPQVAATIVRGSTSLIAGQEVITADAIAYLKTISINVISNIPVAVTRSNTSQVINTFFDGGIHATGAVTRNYDVIANVILYGPDVAPVPYSGSGFFATTGVSSNDVRQSPQVLTVTSLGGNEYSIKLSLSTIGAVYNGTLYFGNTAVYPLQDNEIPDEWSERRVDAIGSMGGMLVDGAVVSERSPITSMVMDAFTQVNQGGRGIYVTNNGYAQLVSVFTIFCSIAVQTDNGGIASITNSNCNFGNLGLVSKGYGKREFSGTVFNPPYPTYQPNGEYYPNGYYPKNGIVEIFLPDPSYRPHISLVMEVEPPVGTINEQGFAGFINAAPNTPTLTAGAITISGIDTTGIAIGNSLNVRDQYGNINYTAADTTVVDVNYQSITLSKGLIRGGGDVNNPNYFTLYFSGKSYYTVLSSTVTDSHKTIGDRVIPSGQLEPELNAISFVKSAVSALLSGQGINAESIDFVNVEFNIITNTVGATDFAAAQLIVPTPTTSGLIPADAALAIIAIDDNTETIVSDTLAHINASYPSLVYNATKCARDVRQLLYEITNDLTTGGNARAAASGLSYWVGPLVFNAGQIGPEITAIRHIRDMLTTATTGLLPLASVPIAAIDFVNAKLGIVESIIVAPNLTAAYAVVPTPAKTGVPPTGVSLAISTINANIESIVTSTLLDLGAFIYNQTTCSRDTGLIVDAIALDLLYDSTSESTFAGIQYWSQGGSSIPGEEPITIAAIAYLQTLATADALSAGDIQSSVITSSLFNIIIDIITNGTIKITDTIVSNGLDNTDPIVVAAYDALVGNITTYQTDVINWITANYPTFVYNTVTCARDVSFIVSSVAFDLLHGGNKQSIKSGVYYYGYSNTVSAVPQEIPQVIGAYNYINTIVESIVKAELLATPYQSAVLQDTSLPAATNAEVTSLQVDIAIITDIIINGPTVAPAKEPINLTKNGSSDVANAYALLVANREFIKAETIAFIEATYNYNGAFFNTVKCARDVRIILRQLTYDLEFGGDYYSTFSGLSYWIREGTHHIVNLEEALNNTALFPDGATVNFYQRSYISASGYLFEYVGAGTNYGALPQRGVADPVQSKEVIQLNSGKVFFTSTDQNGDFRIGPGLVISQATGVLSGRTFTKSLFANMTPFILAIEGT